MSIQTQKNTLMKRRKIATIVTLSLVALLIPIIIFVNYFVKIKPFYDVDQTKYLIKYKGGIYSMFDEDGKVLDIDSEYGYYITDLGTLVKLNSETGEYEIIAVVDTEGTEQLGFNQRILMFPHTEKKNIRSIEIVNSEGSFTFHRYNVEKKIVDDSCDFIIKGSPFATFDQELFASLYVSTGYTITTRKIEDPIKDANGEFSEYGLVSETRVDEENKEYTYTPAYYILTDTSGNKHKVIIGDMLVTGGGYYVQYVSMEDGTETKRDAVYVLSTSIGDTVLQPVESFVAPTIVYPMSMNSYFDVEDFVITQRDETAEGGYRATLGFSYIDLSLREDTIEANFPYEFTLKTLKGYRPDADNINAALYYLYDTAFVGVTKLAPTDSDFIKYGLAKEITDSDGKPSIEFEPEYIVSFDYDIRDESGNVESTINEVLMISAKNENNNYYVYTLIYDADSESSKLLYSYDMIVEVEGHGLEFLTWGSSKWINKTYIMLNIAYCEEITLESPDYSAKFTLDNSKTPIADKASTSHLEVIGTDSKGNNIKTFSSITIPDKAGNIWTVTSSEVKAVNSSGTTLKISTAYYAYNILGTQVRVVSGYIEAFDGSKIYVTADTVTVEAPNGEKVEYVRYATSLFRKYYQTIISSTVENSYEMTKEEEQALLADESKWMLTITVKDSTGTVNTYSFYKLDSNRKAYLTINGNGGFYVLSNRVNKYITDSQKFFAYEVIEPLAKK